MSKRERESKQRIADRIRPILEEYRHIHKHLEEIGDTPEYDLFVDPDNAEVHVVRKCVNPNDWMRTLANLGLAEPVETPAEKVAYGEPLSASQMTLEEPVVQNAHTDNRLWLKS